MMNFQTFKTGVAKQFASMAKSNTLFRVDISKDELWQTYLSSFPEGTNPVYKTRTEHDCNCCKQFIRAVGDVVAIKDGQLISIWNTDAGHPAYQAVADALAAKVTSANIADQFFHFEKTAGTNKTYDATVNQEVVAWDHFFVNIPDKFVKPGKDIPSILSEIRSKRDLFLRGLQTLNIEDIDTILELIAQNTLYRGSEHTFALTEFRKHLVTSKNLNQELYAWTAMAGSSAAVLGIRNTVIGTILVDLAEGKDLEQAIKSYEVKVAPANYKRPTALVTPKMVAAAKETIQELGLTSALERRYANINDITINNILFANRDARKAMTGDVFDDIATSTKKSMDKVEEVGIEKFLTDILPKATSVEAFLENRHTSNLVSLIAPVDASANPLFKWDNGFGWSYNGDMADSIKERVKAAGGSVEGDLCCRLAWDYSDDLDFHMHEPNGGHIYFSTRRFMSRNGGVLDVDANGADGPRENPVENIFYKTKSTMAEGTYTLAVNNYNRRSSGKGFEVEIEIDGTQYNFVYDRVLSTGSTIEVADIVYSKKTGFAVKSKIPSTQTSKKIWGLNSQNFHKVNVMMLSPNYWDDKTVGNKHYFFMLDGCTNDGKARGFYNEFLRSDLDKHRKVIEIVGSKMKTQETDNQLSGLGFSSTQRNTLVVKVDGSFTRTLKIVF